MEDTTTHSPNQDTTIQLGDILKLIAPADERIHEKLFYVNYIDTEKAELLESDGEKYTMYIEKDGTLRNKSISSIEIMSRPDEPGYARQHDLLPGTWINVEFGGDLPTIITGKIINLEEDQIEVKTSDGDNIFIDFGYRGLPENIPIEKITIRDPPLDSVSKDDSVAQDDIVEQDDRVAKDEDTARSVDSIDDTYIADTAVPQTTKPELQQQIRDVLLQADQIIIGDTLEEVSQVVDVPESEQRFGIEKQTADLLDELLSTIPNQQRTETVLNNIHVIIERFKQLRAEFSVFDNNNNALLKKTQGAQFKPLISSLKNLSQKLYWILPVAQNKKKLYDIDVDAYEEFTDIEPLTLAQARSEEYDITQQYLENNIPEGETSQHFMANSINPYLTPYTNTPLSSDNIIDQSVQTNITAIIDNLDDFYSSVAHNDDVRRKRFLIQEYNLGLSTIHTEKKIGGGIVIKPKKLTPNDIMVIKSFVTLPESALVFSKINLPMTDMMTKSSLNRNFIQYWKLLTDKRVVNPIVVDLESELQYDDSTYLSSFKEFILDANVTDQTTSAERNELFETFLDKIVPKTRTLFDMVKDNISGKLSIHGILKYLEPFMIYQKDLSFKQYQEFTKFIEEKIKNYKKTYAQNIRNIAPWKQKNFPFAPPQIFAFLIAEYYSLMISGYGFESVDDMKKINDSEFLNKVILTDGGRLYSAILAKISSTLMLNGGVEQLEQMELISKEAIDDIKDNDACKKYVLSKKYLAIDEMEEDNNQTIYFDKQYDKTYYNLIDEYADVIDDSLSREEKIKILQGKLQENNGLSQNEARRDATAMVDKKRVIEDGDYCVVINETPQGPDMLYYQRENNVWIPADQLPENIFTESSKTFCNLNENCLDMTATCETMEDNAKILQDKSIDNILNEFTDNLRVGADIIQSRILTNLERATKRISVLREISADEEYKYNNKHLLIGDTSIISDIVVSPYTSLREKILGQGDLAKRQTDIGKFVEYFTRPPGDDEDQLWLYCKDTNTKLLPSFVAKLAKVFVENGNYILAIERICAEQGTISDDGDNWVDKHSGYIITSIEFNNDEGYTESGFKVKSRELLEEERGNAIIQADKKKYKYENINAQKIFNVVNAMGKYTGIDISTMYEFTVKHSLELLQKSMPSKEAYNAARDAALAKGKKRETYEVAYHSSLVIITLCFFLISVQTSIPPITTRKRHPGCARSFSGYPLTGIEDVTGLTYISCVAFKIKSSVEPWDGIASMGQKSIIKRVKSMLETYITKMDIVKDKISEKLEYMVLHDKDEIESAHDIKAWSTFLPPLQVIKLGVVENVTKEFTDLFISELKTGGPKQLEQLNVMQSKSMYFSLKIQSLVHNVVKKASEILSLHNNEPLLENACCDSDSLHTLDYFVAREPEIVEYNNNVNILMNIVDDANAMAKASIIFDARNTRIAYPQLPTEFSEEIIYRAFIQFCKYDSDIPVGEELRAICMEKPGEFDPDDSIEDKIKLLKRNGHNYSPESFQQLMQIINKQNIVDIDLYQLHVNNIQQLQDMINSLHEDVTGVVTNDFLNKFEAILDTFERDGLMEDTKEMRDFKNYLARTNETMEDELLDFVARANLSGIVKPKMQRMFRECLKTISQFKETGDDVFIEKSDETVFKMIEFMKNTIRNLARVLPNIILNNVDFKATRIPKHWNLSEKHDKDLQEILNKHYVTLYNLYNDDDIHFVLKKVERTNINIAILAELTEYYAPIKVGDDKYLYSVFDRRLCSLLFTHYFCMILKNIQNTVDDEDIILRSLNVPSISREEQDLSPSTSVIEEQQMGIYGDLEVIQGEKKAISDKVATIIYSFVNIICNDKETINYNYDSFMERVMRSREKEKDIITDFLKEMTDEERETENLFKNNKLERWSKGLQKGVRIYQKDTYDEERNAMEAQALAELRMGETNVVTDMNKNIFAMEHIEEQLSAEKIADEEMSMKNVVNDDDYGEFDGDEEY